MIAHAPSARNAPCCVRAHRTLVAPRHRFPVYPRGFANSNGDGMSDIPGNRSELCLAEDRQRL
jgi:hypothetical protein